MSSPSSSSGHVPHVLTGQPTPLSVYKGGDVTMKASISTQQQFAAAPAATIATAIQAERPRAGEPAIRLGDLLPKAARSDESMYAFLYFTRGEGGAHGGAVYYAAPGAHVHADARLCTAGQGVGGILALAKVCGGSGEGRGGNNGQYPETILVGEDSDGFDDSGIRLDRIIGSDSDEDEDTSCDERAAAAERRAKEVGGVVYTQVDVDGGSGIAYELGVHRVNRTGIYAVVTLAHGANADGGASGALAGVISEADVMASRAAPNEAAMLVSNATKSLAEAEYEAKQPGRCDEILGMLDDARNNLTHAAAAYRLLAEHAEAAAGTVHRAWSAAHAKSNGECPLNAALCTDGDDVEYVDEWYDDYDADQRDDMCSTDDNVEYYTDECKRRMEKIAARRKEHDLTCRHASCVATRAAPGKGGGSGKGSRKRRGDDGGRDGL